VPLHRSLNVRIRTAVDSDAQWATDAYNAANPDEPHDVAFTKWIWGLADDEWLDWRYAVELDGKPLGWLMLEHVIWRKNPERYAGIDAWLHPDLYSRRWLDYIFSVVERDARKIEAAALNTNVRETAPQLLAALLGRGYIETGRQRYLELDLHRHRERLIMLAKDARDRAEQQGVRLLTLAEDGPDLEDELHACYEDARQDMPSTAPWLGLSPQLFRKWLNEPQKRPDRFWIARVDGTLAGMSVLAYPAREGSVASTSWTGIARRFRGRGLARTLKLAALAQAGELGVTRVRTDTDSKNSAMLHLNEALGYVEVPGHVKLRLALQQQ
jgi:RimJ/RimL family protein N-acetyltransferase